MVPIECAPHDIFEPTHQPFWEATALQFEAELKSLDLELGQFLDDSFTKLRFAKETFKLLEKWRAVQSGDANAEELIARHGSERLLERVISFFQLTMTADAPRSEPFYPCEIIYEKASAI